MVSPHNTPPLPNCSQEQRLDRLEIRADAHDVVLTDGKVEFASIKKDLAQIMATQAEIKLALANRTRDVWEQVVGAIIFWGVPALCTAAFWAIAKSGAVIK